MIIFQEEREGREPKFLLTKNRTTIDPAVPLLGIYFKKIENTNFKRYMHPSVSSSIIYNCQGIKATKMSTNKYMDKGDVAYRILFNHKKECNFSIYNNMDGLGGYFAE